MAISSDTLIIMIKRAFIYSLYLIPTPCGRRERRVGSLRVQHGVRREPALGWVETHFIVFSTQIPWGISQRQMIVWRGCPHLMPEPGTKSQYRQFGLVQDVVGLQVPSSLPIVHVGWSCSPPGRHNVGYLLVYLVQPFCFEGAEDQGTRRCPGWTRTPRHLWEAHKNNSVMFRQWLGQRAPNAGGIIQSSWLKALFKVIAAT